jgi:hypothetical protein
MKVSKVNPTAIFDILDLAKQARSQGHTFNPLYSGDAGLGKSAICQQWVARQQEIDPNFQFIDLRMAYMEAPDLIGLPRITSENKTDHILPSFWPTSGSGLLLLEEPNRANSSVMNCLMQLLTDRTVHHYKLPDGWIIAACINPENSNYDVNAMDIALRDRFEIYPIGYDFSTFKSFMKAAKYHHHIQNFVGSGLWLFKSPEELGEDGQYVSPRTWSKLNSALMSGVENYPDLFYKTVISKLGDVVGREFHKFVTNNAPIMAQDFIADRADALKRLKKACDKEGYHGDLINITVESLSDAYENGIDDQTILDVVKVIPKDQAVNLLQACVIKCKDKTRDLKHFIKLDPSLAKTLKDVLRGDKNSM